MFQSRTHNCNELRIANAGENVKLVGWMENVREVGKNFAFIVLRDFYGTTQVVIETEDMMNIVKPLNNESVISVEGVVRERSSKNCKASYRRNRSRSRKKSKCWASVSTTSCRLKSTAARKQTKT